MIVRVLAVDDEPPALDELVYLLRDDPRVGEVRTASDAVGALRELEEGQFDAVFLDIRMPGLSGLDLAKVLARFAQPPAVVFVTAHDGAAVDAFALRAVDYLLKPLRRERLSEALDRLVPAAPREGGATHDAADDDTVAVELGGVTRFIAVADVRFAEAQGDYARLHTSTGSHLLRVPMAVLEQRWARFGFVRVHRSFLVAASHITELRVEPGGGHVIRVGAGPGAVSIPVSRRHTRQLKDRLVRRARDAGRNQP